MKPHSRRSFIKNLSCSSLALCCGSAGIGILLDGCTSIKYIQTTVNDNKIVVNLSEFTDHKFIVLNTDKLPCPIYLYKINDSSYNALLMLCTHKDCSVAPTGSFLTCPCHGSQFSNNGKVLKGPATESLTQYYIQISKTNVTIDLNQQVKS